MERFVAPPVLVGALPLTSAPRGMALTDDTGGDSILDGGEVPGFTVRAAALRDDDHRYLGEPRQDAFGWPEGGQVLLAVVSDCVGSQPLAHVSATLVCSALRVAIEPYTAPMLDSQRAGDIDDLGRRLVRELTSRLEREADQRGAVGGSPAPRLRDGTFPPFFNGSGGPISSTATAALPDSKAAPEVLVTELLPGDVRVLCTDGSSILW